MKKLTLTLIFIISFSANLFAAEVIKFKKGETGAKWSGIVKNGEKSFTLNLRKRQSLTVNGGNMYTWNVTLPNGKTMGCDGNGYCTPGDSIDILPMSGNYIITVAYRVSACADCPVIRQSKETVLFLAN